MGLKLKTERCGKMPLVRAKGRVSDNDVDLLTARLDQVSRTGAPRLFLDVSEVEFMDSRGLGTVVYYHTMLQRDHRELVVVNANATGFMHELMETTHLNHVLRCVANPSEATQAP